MRFKSLPSAIQRFDTQRAFLRRLNAFRSSAGQWRTSSEYKPPENARKSFFEFYPFHFQQLIFRNTGNRYGRGLELDHAQNGAKRETNKALSRRKIRPVVSASAQQPAVLFSDFLRGAKTNVGRNANLHSACRSLVLSSPYATRRTIHPINIRNSGSLNQAYERY